MKTQKSKQIANQMQVITSGNYKYFSVTFNVYFQCAFLDLCKYKNFQAT